jgi:drug/metabolite transporter (DMT)-like permease
MADAVSAQCKDQEVAQKDGDATVRDGRVSGTALFGFLAAGFGSNLFDGPTDTLRAVMPFVITMLTTGALIIELTDQARRRPTDGGSRWAGTDTGIVTVLLGYTVLLAVAAALQRLPASEETAAASFATLYAVLAGCFGWVRRRRTSSGRPAAR